MPNTDRKLRRRNSNITPLQEAVTVNGETEPKFRNAYWDHYEPGIYVDIHSGEALFASSDKIRSKSGWPGFSRPVTEDALTFLTDDSDGSPRTEVRSKIANAHLGHVFRDGPTGLSETGKWFCINSAALRFIPRSQMAEEGYAALLSALFEIADASSDQR